jgi:hypothetical protein
MVASGVTKYFECEAWSVPIYAESDRLTHEQMMAGESCPSCGEELISRGDPPSWIGKGTMYLTDKEQAARTAAEQAFKERHPDCHAWRWSMAGSAVSHCGRCCPPPPMSPDQIRRISQILQGSAEERVRKVRREGTTYERHELERRLPGRARPVAAVLREYNERRAKALAAGKGEDRALIRSSFPDAELLFRWRMQLGCGDIVEILTLGDDRPPTEMTWSWGGSPLRKGTYACTGHPAVETPYQQVSRYLTRSTLDLKGDKDLGRESKTVGYWTVKLECGHLDHQITPLDWKPADGHQQTEPNNPDEVAQRKARMEQIKEHLGVAEYTQAIRRIEQCHLEPDPMTTCWTCQYEQAIVAFQRAGWLVPPNPVKGAPGPDKAVAARPTRVQLEKRVADLEAEIARLKQQ